MRALRVGAECGERVVCRVKKALHSLDPYTATVPSWDLRRLHHVDDLKNGAYLRGDAGVARVDGFGQHGQHESHHCKSAVQLLGGQSESLGENREASLAVLRAVLAGVDHGDGGAGGRRVVGDRASGEGRTGGRRDAEGGNSRDEGGRSHCGWELGNLGRGRELQ